MNISCENGRMRVRDVEFDARLTLMDSAQVFHWEELEEGRYAAVVAERRVTLECCEDGFVLWNVGEEDVPFWRNYFDLDRDYGRIVRNFEQYPVAQQAVLLLPGMRVLNQPAWEALLTFILSANNNVSRIRQLVQKLTAGFGTDGSFPTAEQLSAVSEAELRGIGCGYRAPYLIRTAEMIRDGFPLEALRCMPYEEAHEMLTGLPGVGDKVADCVQLFGLGHSEAFPVDVWVERLMKKWFVPDAHGKREIRKKAHEIFGKNAGIIQQYLFHCARLGLIPLEDQNSSAR